MNGPLKPDFETLSAYLDDELEPTRRAAVQAWLDAHPEERGELERMRERERRIAQGPAPRDPRRGGEAPEAPLDLDALTRNVWDEIDRQRDRAAGRGFWLGRRIPTRPAVWIPVAAAAAVFLLFQNPPPRSLEPLMRPRRAAVTVPPAKAPATTAQAPAPAEQALAPAAPAQALPPARAGAAHALNKAAQPGPVHFHGEASVSPASPALEEPQKHIAGRTESVPPAASPSGAAHGTIVTGERQVVRMKDAAKPEGKPSDLSEKPVDNLVQVPEKSEGIRSYAPSIRSAAARMTTHERMTHWLLVVDRSPGQAPAPAPDVGPADSIAATAGFWVAQPGADSLHTRKALPPMAREALAWALTEKYLLTHAPADCAAAREALTAALRAAPGANLAAFLRECWQRLGECAGGPAPG